MLCAIRAPHKTIPNFVTQYVIFCELWDKISVPDIVNLGLALHMSYTAISNQENKVLTEHSTFRYGDLASRYSNLLSRYGDLAYRYSDLVITHI